MKKQATYEWVRSPMQESIGDKIQELISVGREIVQTIPVEWKVFNATGSPQQHILTRAIIIYWFIE